MKLKLLISFLLILLLSSCDNMFEFTDDIFFWPAGVDKNITKKTSVKPFSDLESPIVVAMPIYENHNFLGVHSWGSKVWQAGNVIVVYDWKNDSVFDWAFTKGSCGWNNYQMLLVNGNWWGGGLDGSVTKISPYTGEITVYKHGIVSRIECQTANGKYILLSPEGRYDSESNRTIKKYYRFNTETGLIEDDVYTINCDEVSTFPLCDDQGNFWLTSIMTDKKVLHKLTPAGEDIQVDIPNEGYDEYNHVYEVCLIDGDSVFIHAHDFSNLEDSLYPCMYVYNKNSSRFFPVDINEISFKGYNIYDGIRVDDKNYFICLSEELGKDLRLGLYDPEINKISITDEVLAYNFTGWPYRCGSRIYMLDWWDMQVLKYQWYDTEKSSFSEPKVIKLEDIISN